MSARSRGRHVIANGVRLHYLEFPNDRPPLVLIPGITSPAVTWGFVGARLAADSHVYILDNRGRGLSQGGADLGYRLDDYAADTRDFIKTLGLGQPTIAGHSMGGRVAIRLAARFPDVCGKLVLIDPPVTGPGRKPYPLPLAWYLDTIDSVSNGHGWDEMKKVLPWSEDQLDLRMQWLPTCDRTAIAESYKSFLDENIHDDLPSVRSKTLLIYAQNGGTISEDDANEVMRLLRDGRKQRIDNAGHMIPWDQLDAFIGTVHGFLSRQA
jgi:N-formylmaleamate deformylase